MVLICENSDCIIRACKGHTVIVNMITDAVELGSSLMVQSCSRIPIQCCNQDLQRANKRIFDLENAQQNSQTHLEQAGNLRREVKELTSQLHVLSNLYQQQNDRLQSFRLLSQQEAEWKAKMAALAQEKDEAVWENLKLRQQLEGCKAQLEEHELEKQYWEKDLHKMKVQREEERGRAWTKIKVRT